VNALPDAIRRWTLDGHDRSAELLPGDLVRLRRGSATVTLRVVDAVAFAERACGGGRAVERQQLSSPDHRVMRDEG
jgi:hypothetical protein